MTTKSFKVTSSACAGVIAVLVALFYASTKTTWGLASDEAPVFVAACGVVAFLGFMLFYGPQDLWERFNPESYQNFVTKITSSFVKFSDEITRYEE